MTPQPSKTPKAEELSLSRPGSTFALQPPSRRRGGSRLPSLIGLLLIFAGLLVLADAGVTLVWQEPLSALYAQLKQESLRSDLRALERALAYNVRASAHSRAYMKSVNGSPIWLPSCNAMRGRLCRRTHPHPHDRCELRGREGHRHLRTRERSRHLPRNSLPRCAWHDRYRRPPHYLPCALPSHRRAASGTADRVRYALRPPHLPRNRLACGAPHRRLGDSTPSVTRGSCYRPVRHRSAPLTD